MAVTGRSPAADHDRSVVITVMTSEQSLFTVLHVVALRCVIRRAIMGFAVRLISRQCSCAREVLQQLRDPPELLTAFAQISKSRCMTRDYPLQS